MSNTLSTKNREKVSVSGFVTIVTKCAINTLASPTMSKPTRVLSLTTHSNGDPLSSNDFSNFTNSLSPTPELQYTGNGTSNMSTRSVHVKPIRVWTGNKEGNQACVCVGVEV